VVETSRTRLESLLLPPKNLRDASGPAARFSLGPPTGSLTATIDVEIAGYRVKADTALLFGHLARSGLAICCALAGMAGLTLASTVRYRVVRYIRSGRRASRTRKPIR
jgi:hypothetical protein